MRRSFDATSGKYNKGLAPKLDQYSVRGIP
jgi:hypothetical protein